MKSARKSAKKVGPPKEKHIDDITEEFHYAICSVQASLKSAELYLETLDDGGLTEAMLRVTRNYNELQKLWKRILKGDVA